MIDVMRADREQRIEQARVLLGRAQRIRRTGLALIALGFIAILVQAALSVPLVVSVIVSPIIVGTGFSLVILPTAVRWQLRRDERI